MTLSPPAPPKMSSIKDTSAVVTFTSTGSGILERRVMYYDNDPYATTGVVYKTLNNASPATGTITGLKAGASYTIAAMTRDASGWSYPSADVVFQTYSSYKVPPAPDAPILSLVTQTSLRASFTDNGNNNFSITAREISYGTASTATGFTKTSTNATPSIADLTGLTPGLKYYFKSRVENLPGWSSYSAIVSVTLLAGAWVKYNGVWKQAVPYVNVAGTWKVARPWGKIAGVWKECQ